MHYFLDILYTVGYSMHCQSKQIVFPAPAERKPRLRRK